jgi:glycerol-3-phosphate dehydrogenase
LVTFRGTRAADVLKEAGGSPGRSTQLAGVGEVTEEEITYIVKHEIVEHLDDVLLRRTDLGSLGHPGKDCAEAVAEIMARELGWEEPRKQRELREFDRLFPQIP